ncbi:2-amino-4-hydroxy-6-hydroxymethyldihydropteridine diphosphokinase [Sediminibacillus massiliensis]|uniref:2-amino-4-hydroxy-6- hydroxymethyldihydropteridine diphosphokinase n=1 Tax=Sediminibacillus massiliensis TaxID=1926277 RepID=UPI00098838B1|nr:2-amino-4-hydroxy-6-hydroxymethyldihydropteridine diphosphokinase [Sediminibacillus massiliensis]
MNTAYIALGSNISPRIKYLKEAVTCLDRNHSVSVTAQSEIYETAPVGYTDQGNFLNMVVEVNTTLAPMELLNLCQSIEKDHGRKREIRWGPRTLDLDILLFNQENIKTEQLIVPHPRMHERAFVLIPLNDIHPQGVIPAQNNSVSAILDKMPIEHKKGVMKWEPMNGAEE